MTSWTLQGSQQSQTEEIHRGKTLNKAIWDDKWKWEKGIYLSELCFHGKIAVGLNTKNQLIVGTVLQVLLTVLNWYLGLHYFIMMPCSISARKYPSLEQTRLQGSTGAAEKTASSWCLPARQKTQCRSLGLLCPWSRVSRTVTHFSSSKAGHNTGSAVTVLGCASHQSHVPGSTRGDAGGCRDSEGCTSASEDEPTCSAVCLYH